MGAFIRMMQDAPPLQPQQQQQGYGEGQAPLTPAWPSASQAHQVAGGSGAGLLPPTFMCAGSAGAALANLIDLRQGIQRFLDTEAS